MVFEENEITKLASKYINSTGKHLFLTGKAGTGKTTFLKQLLKYTYKKNIVVAPTGVAAINAGGVTIHSQFQLPLATFIPDPNHYTDQPSKFVNPRSILQNFRMNRSKRNILRSLELLIIDEVSMVRADLLDAIDTILRHIRRNRSQPFGGVQVLFIGDLLQLPPIVRPIEKRELDKYYTSLFFFDAHVLRANPPLHLELEKIYRQSDRQFIAILANLRQNKLTQSDQEILNRYVEPDLKVFETENYIYLTTHNRTADRINQRRLAELEADAFTFEARIKGDFPESMYPVPVEITLKRGAQVMFTKNDYTGKNRYFNGKIGIVSDLGEDYIVVSFEDGSADVEAEIFTWENKKYTLKPDGEIETDVKGIFTQYPLRTAWAITVHKSQGLTFQKAIIDVSQAFEAGQIYVALSRLVSLEGLVLATPITTNDLKTDDHIFEFNKTRSDTEILESNFKTESYQFALDYVCQTFDLTNLRSEVSYFISSFDRDESRSKKQKDLQWAKEFFKRILELDATATKFRRQIKGKTESTNFKTFLLARVEAAKTYFIPLFQNNIDDIEAKLKLLRQIEGVKGYYREVQHFKTLLNQSCEKIERGVKMIGSIAESKTLLRENPRVEVVRTPKPKLPTHLVSYNLYREGKTLIQIAQIRGFTLSTIEKHFIKCLEQDLVSFEKYISEAEINTIIEAACELETNFSGPLKDYFKDRFSYFQIKIALSIWKNGA